MLPDLNSEGVGSETLLLTKRPFVDVVKNVEGRTIPDQLVGWAVFVSLIPLTSFVVLDLDGLCGLSVGLVSLTLEGDETFTSLLVRSELSGWSAFTLF